MAIDLTSESTLTLTQAARLLPPGRRDRPVSMSCVLRWVLTGTRTSSGEVVCVEALRLGGRWITSREALQRFADRLTPRLGEPPPPIPCTPGHRRRASERAAAELDRIGI
jgi:hypothetical protein